MAVTTNTSRLRVAWTGLRALLVLTVLLGVAYPLAVTGISQVAFPGNADGSVLEVDGKPVGSDLVGQTWDLPLKDGQETADPNPEWFQGRPSSSGYAMYATGASNLAAGSPELTETIKERKAQVAEFNGVDRGDVPPDAVTASGSGLDPHISPDYAGIQVDRVAEARGLDRADVEKLVDEHTQGRTLGFLGDPRVNVLELNAAVRKLG